MKLWSGQWRLKIGYDDDTDPLDTRTFCALSSERQGKFRLMHGSHGATPEHLIFCWRQRSQLRRQRYDLAMDRALKT